MHKRSWESKRPVATFSVFVFLLQDLPARSHFKCSTLLHHCQYLILLFILHFLPCWPSSFVTHYTLTSLSVSFTKEQQAAYSNFLQTPRDGTKVSSTAVKEVSPYAPRTTEVSALITMGFYQTKKLLRQLWLHSRPFYWFCSSCSQVQLKKSKHAFTWGSSSLLTSLSQLCQGLAQGAMKSTQLWAEHLSAAACTVRGHRTPTLTFPTAVQSHSDIRMASCTLTELSIWRH